MKQQTKMAKFRILLPVIEQLLNEYTYEGTIEELEKQHGLKLTLGTFTNYLHNARNENLSKTLISKTADLMPKTIENDSIESTEDLSTNVDNFEEDENGNPDAKSIQEALAKFKRSTATRSIKSVQNKGRFK